MDERVERARKIAREQKWNIKKKPRISKWFWIMLAGLVAYLIITYVVKGG